jgi:pimeloyl-ACP methyl ester carboxylesterase
VKNNPLEDWREKGQFFSFEGHQIFYIDQNKSAEKVIAILHGYPSCSYDYKDILPSLSEEYRVIIPDFLGFGLSSKPQHEDYLLTTQAEIVKALCKELNIESLHLVAHDYGTSVATELVAQHNHQQLDFNLLSLTLTNGSMLIDMSQLRPIQKLLKHPITGPIVARLSNANTFHKNMRNIWYDKTIYDRIAMQPIWTMLTSNGGKKVLPVITRYINQRYANYDRWIGALEKTGLPVHILWAENDPVAVVGMAHRLKTLIPHAVKTIIPECGHYPMIEKGQEWTNLLLQWFVHQDKPT